MDNRKLYSVRFSLYVACIVLVTSVIAFGLRADLMQRFIPRAVAMKGNEKVMYWHVAADTMIALCSYTVATLLFSLVNYKKDLYFRGIIFAIALFVFLSGVCHTMNVVAIWVTWYWLDAIAKTLTALSILGLVISLPVTINIVKRLKTPAEYRQLIEETKKLREEINELREWKQQS